MKRSSATSAPNSAAKPPGVVTIDTLNRAIQGDENASADMAKFIRAADAIRAAFDCLVIIVHHGGIVGSRPRGHTSLAGADDAQIAVERNKDGVIHGRARKGFRGRREDRLQAGAPSNSAMTTKATDYPPASSSRPTPEPRNPSSARPTGSPSICSRSCSPIAAKTRPPTSTFRPRPAS